MNNRLDTPVTGNRAQRRAAVRTKKVAALGSGMVLAAAGASTALTLASSAPAGAAAPIVVDSLTDDGTGLTLREAIDQANTDAGQDVITFSVTGTITLASDLPNIEDALQIQGPGAGLLTIDGADQYGVFNFYQIASSDGVDEVSGLTITRGVGVNNDNSGGAISDFESSANLTIANAVLDDNYASNDGGAVSLYDSTGDVLITGTTISNNVADAGGGGLYADANGGTLNLTIVDSVITGNTAGSDDGGGLYVDSANLVLRNSVVSNNDAGDAGGGLYLYNSDTLIEYSTISGNSADAGGGGIHLYDEGTDSTFAMRNSTVSGNSAGYYGGGLYIGNSGGAIIENSTISGNTAAHNGGGVFVTYDADTGFTLTQSTVTNNTATSPLSGPAVGGVLVSAPQIIRSRDAADAHAGDAGKSARVKGQRVGAAALDTIALTGTIVSGNAGEDIGSFGDLTADSDHSLLGTIGADVTVNDVGGTISSTNPGLEPLANNGGPTQTHALAVGSPAKDTGPNPLVPFTGSDFDQRGAGYARVVDGVVDVGAFEVQAPPPIIIQPRFTG